MRLFTSQSILSILVSLLFVLFPFTNLLRLEIGDDIALNGIDLLVGITGGIWLLHFLIKRDTYHFYKPIMMFLFVCVTSLVIAIPQLTWQQTIVALLYFLRFASYTMIYFAVTSIAARSKDTLRSLLFFSGGLLVLFGYIQYFFYSDLRNLSYLGWDEHVNRMFSTFFDPNFAGAFFVLYFIFVLCQFLEKSKDRSLKVKTLYSVILVATLIAIFLTFSRSALIMLVISGVLVLILLDKLRVLLYGGIFFLLAFFVLATTSTSENTNLFRVTSSIARFDTMKEAVTLFKKAPLFGVGFNAYKFALQRYELRKDSEYIPDHGDLGTDNSFLFVLATTGIIGLGFYLYMWVTVLQAMFRKKNTMSFIVIASVVGLGVNGLFINSQFYPFILLWVWTIVGLTDT